MKRNFYKVNKFVLSMIMISIFFLSSGQTVSAQEVVAIQEPITFADWQILSIYHLYYLICTFTYVILANNI